MTDTPPGEAEGSSLPKNPPPAGLEPETVAEGETVENPQPAESEDEPEVPGESTTRPSVGRAVLRGGYRAATYPLRTRPESVYPPMFSFLRLDRVWGRIRGR